jgi:ATP-dependent RNA helicase DeaD
MTGKSTPPAPTPASASGRLKAAAAAKAAAPKITTTFAELGLPPEACAALAKRGLVTPTEVQCAVIPLAMGGGDLLAQARTGSGKTLAFLLPLAARIAAGEIARAWIVCPTRELAQQVAREVIPLLGANATAVLVGGTPFGPQLRDLSRGVPLVVGTPGRMVDHVSQGTLKPDADILVLDEADQMLDLGFREDLERLVKDLGSEVARWCFSATFPPAVAEAMKRWLDEPRTVRLDVGSGASHVPQRAVIAQRGQEIAAIARLLHMLEPARALVFVRTREQVEMVVRAMAAEGVESAGISGELSQEARERVLGRFRAGGLPVLVGTDVAARGIDVPGVTHVFNLGLPMTAESYTHRVGRTARAGAEGEAWTVIAPNDRFRLKRMAAIGKCNIEEVPLPTAAHLVESKRKRLAVRAQDALGENLPLPPSFAELVKEHGAEAVLSALIHRLIPDAGPERQAPTGPRPGHAPSHGGPGGHHAGERSGGRATVLFVGLGSEDGAGTGPLVAMLTRVPGVAGVDIGRIRVLHRHSLVEVRGPAVEALLSSRMHHRGRPVPVREDRQGPQSRR